MKTLDIIRDRRNFAVCEREAGGKIELDSMLPSYSITTSSGSEYYAQEESASETIKEFQDSLNSLYSSLSNTDFETLDEEGHLSIEDFILSSESWC